MAVEPAPVLVCAEPYHNRLAHYMVLWHEAPEAAVCTVVPVVALHPVIVHLEGVFVRLLTVDDDLSLGRNDKFIAFINANGTFIHRQVLQG